jgi:hypothetical protein
MSSPTSVIALEVTPKVPGPSTPGNKRKISPSAERSSSKRSLILVTPNQRPSNSDRGAEIFTGPFFAPKQLFPQGTANVEYTHAHPVSGTVAANDAPIWQTRRVLLPFDLRDPKVDLYGGSVLPLLLNIFPGTTWVTEGRLRSYLHFTVKELPKRPWPLTVGGLPITIGDNIQGRGPLFPRQNLGNPAISICKDFDGRKDQLSDAVFRQLAVDITKEFRKLSCDVTLIEIIFTCELSFYIIVGDEVNINKTKPQLPGKIANCWAGYVLNKEVHRVQWADLKAKRETKPEPLTGIVDNTAYEVLRPGVMICSKSYKDHAHPAVYSTTSGVLVKNVAADRFMTGASHGIGKDETIYQPLPTGGKKIIGKAVQEISFTDVALVQLNRDVDFINETFENSSGAVPKFTRLFGEIPGDESKWLSSHYLNSPYTGNIEGSIVAKSLKLQQRPPKHPTEDTLRYVAYNWSFMGQLEGGHSNKAQPPDGTCGSAIWDEDGVILGFYHFHITEGAWAGFSVSVNASEVVKAGYRLG